MLAFANAKINLGLNVTGKRPDGYHELQTVFYPVKIYDVVEITDAPETTFESYGIAIPGSQSENICLKAYECLKAHFEIPPQRITLLKNIPVGAGLGGGSSDAAFLMKLVNDKFKLGLTTAQLVEYVRPLGADCAFFIENKPVYATGKGDEFSPVELDLSDRFIVLIQPEIHVSTATAYAGVRPQEPAHALRELIELPLSSWAGHIKNDFETSVFERYPEIEQIKTKLYAAGATFASMSGSGSSVFGLFDHPVSLPELEGQYKVFYNV
ncbi:4-(cytidine 5'-diphospho)-2-C-methyl-D-erythritol kinase [Pedobacter faecalis]|uniref:4-(cytidine 5'-diphospho)-2-C-methyl-D-erythritol kinase n=1 Tax=Pedobacter faecalis TaxID=3041495 RepID=UPI0025501605|nr:4-(cytidine 5'-diphospho)-2-C-methyl-D-erythritol kinase [Pedobacter sp. ELA7]